HVNSSGAAFMIGGYDPLAWNSSGTYNIDPTNAGRTAFIFNLTNNTMQAQDLLSVLNSGQYQTLNDASLGPTFGGGADIQVGTNLNSGSLYAYSYGSGFNLLGDVTGTNTLVTYDSVDVFKFTPAPTPEPLTLLIGASGAALFLRRRVRARA
ncbi:MAG TPA: PEP_CTERM-anchored TLD domain-containing protein, partial [Fimbriimonadaceae bacterium]|nr:PEP_CTERM-anchored TLD domain-containing protein [Fimbriimonadaceae bacterium]